MLKKPPTLKDVAEKAGVSRMAVSAVLNDLKSTIRVSGPTRERILEAVAELRYQPDGAARSLRRQRADAIGFYNGFGTIDTMDPFAPNIFLGMQSAAASLSHSLLLYNGFHLKDEATVRRKLLSSKADGVVIWPSAGDADLIKSLGETRKPVIQLGESYPGVPAVVADDAAGGTALARHIAERHTCVLFRRAVQPMLSEARRYEAFSSTAAELGLNVIVSTPADRFDRLTEDEMSLLRTRDRISAVVCWHDASAVQVLRFCLSEGISVPNEIAIAGFDGFEFRDCPPGRRLTTVAVDWQMVARTCVQKLVEMISGATVPDLTVIAGEFRKGDTA